MARASYSVYLSVREERGREGDLARGLPPEPARVIIFSPLCSAREEINLFSLTLLLLLVTVGRCVVVRASQPVSVGSILTAHGLVSSSSAAGPA